MLKSSNLNSVMHKLDEEQTDNMQQDAQTDNNNAAPKEAATNESSASMAALNLSDGVLQVVEPPIERARGQVKELIGKQNKIYIDLSKEKYKLDASELAEVTEMLNNVKRYQVKLMKLKKDMTTIYQRTKMLRKRAENVKCCKYRDCQRRLDKQKQEESLIGSQPQ
ncbi:biogenesis of lysosome-related organelles complex 1 subunit 6 [Drosophila busckii]|uniref:biogenesis of lysosome-related organelles complex 1 subunit 6 n=1 Tax=Drosophila busckii TaxID=30019 RepID=UPI00083EAA4B|nr:biogenesis of lysosome-related organelles complex 1 subunit 6 [Drosophila busckii]